MLGKYATYLLAATALAAAAATTDGQSANVQQKLQQQQHQQQLTWTEVIECYKKPQAAIGCLETRMGRALSTLRDTAVSMARSDPDTSAEDVAGVGDLVQQIGEFITYGISRFFHGEEDEATAAASGAAPVNSATDVDEGELKAAGFCSHCFRKHLQSFSVIVSRLDNNYVAFVSFVCFHIFYRYRAKLTISKRIILSSS